MSHQSLVRGLGLFGAVVVGLGSILGTGAFVAIGLASAQWGDLVLFAIPAAAAVATFNGLSSAYLAGLYPKAGGTYEYGYQTLNPWLGFSAGWLFLLAKTASAASAALGVALYLGVGREAIVGGLAIVVVTALLSAGMKRTGLVNTVLVAISVAGLVAFSAGGLAGFGRGWSAIVLNSPEESAPVLGAVAFLFVAYTGYGRIATLGEEVRAPARTIPRAVIITLAASLLLYMGVGLGGRAIGGEEWGRLLGLGITPADMVAAPFSQLVAVAAVTAMLGVLLNLILGLSRVWLAMGRRGDMPAGLARLDGRSNPTVAVVVAGAAVLATTLIGDIRVAWSFSAMTVLLYYAITNLAALSSDRRRLSAWAGLASCGLLSFYVPATVWLAGLVCIVLGLIWKAVYGRRP